MTEPKLFSEPDDPTKPYIYTPSTELSLDTDYGLRARNNMPKPVVTDLKIKQAPSRKPGIFDSESTMHSPLKELMTMIIGGVIDPNDRKIPGVGRTYDCTFTCYDSSRFTAREHFALVCEALADGLTKPIHISHDEVIEPVFNPGDYTIVESADKSGRAITGRLVSTFEASKAEINERAHRALAVIGHFAIYEYKREEGADRFEYSATRDPAYKPKASPVPKEEPVPARA